MKLSQIFIFLFCFFSAISILGIIVDNEGLFLLGKTILFPCLMFYCFELANKKNFFFLLFMSLFYLADVIIIIQPDNQSLYLNVILNINHIIILWYTYKNIEKKPIDKTILVFTIFMFLLGLSIQYLIYDLIVIKNYNAAIGIFLSGILVCIFNSISFYNYLKRNCYVYYYFGFACLSMAFMYLFFNIYFYLYNVKILRILSLCFKILAYFLFVKFIIEKNIRDNKLKNIRPQ